MLIFHINIIILLENHSFYKELKHDHHQILPNFHYTLNKKKVKLLGDLSIVHKLFFVFVFLIHSKLNFLNKI